MRIVSGRFKGKFIKAPNRLPVRPTTDFAKEALFNVLNNRFHIHELEVLDLFAGTGNISYEFVSRGVQQISSVDQNSGCVSFIRKTMQELESNANVIESDVISFLKRTKTNYDLIFMDPPYDYDSYEKAISLVFENKMLKPKGELIVEHDKQRDFSQLEGFLECRKYGKVNFSFFEYI